MRGPALLSRNQVDQLGDRLRAEDYADEDLRALDRFRRSYAAAYERTVKAIRDELQLAPTGRPAKSTSAIREKLQRESIRLSQMQDIAGCRLLVVDRSRQRIITARLTKLFPRTTVVDRRDRPKHGYRAVHVIVWIDDNPVEVQIRTEPQHAWAEYSEKLADTIDPQLKYGGGPQGPRAILDALSNVVDFIEQMELGGSEQQQEFATAVAEVASQLAELHRPELHRD